MTIATSTAADELFAAIGAAGVIEERVSNEVARILEFDWGQDPPCDDITFDPYDASFELKGCRNDLLVMKDQCEQLWALGFDRFWLCHLDGAETYYWKGCSAGSRKERK